MVFQSPSRYREKVLPRWAKLSDRAIFPPQVGRTPREKAGIAYEKKVHRRLYDLYGLDYIPSQWFTYFDGESIKHCQPDGLLLFPQEQLMVIVEVKYSHTPDAFWQLEHLYVPVLRAFMRDSGWRIATCEVVKWFDPAVAFPVRPTLRESLVDVRVGEFAVHILNR